MKVHYTAKWVEDYGISYTPRLNVVFSNPQNNREIPVVCLVDSGAADTLLNPQFGEALGIDVASGERITYGTAGSLITGYLHMLKIRVIGDKRVYEVPCAIAPTGGFGALLGQRGFFDQVVASTP